ncbi:MAG: Nif3-like dinuclear metal center hexameric protein [Candidatus Hodarchaeota archaeon]
MYLTQIIENLNAISPNSFLLKDEDVGLRFGRKTNFSDIIIKKCLVTVDPTIDCIEKAVDWKANLIISHHNLFFKSFFKIKEISYEKTRLLSEKNVWVYVLGESWIAADEGISQSICQGLKLKIGNVFNVPVWSGSTVPMGRICPLDERISLEQLVKQVKSITNAPLIASSPDGNHLVSKLLVIGSGINKEDWIEQILQYQVDTIITGEVNHGILCILNDLNINVLQLGHYHADIFGMSKLKFLLSLKHPNVDFELYENKKQSYKLM